MDQNAFHKRRKSLEEAFFSKQNQDLIDKLHAQKAAEQSIQELQAATGIQNVDVLSELVKHGLSVSSMAALSLVPHINVAWADGQMEPKERQAILKAAGERGISEGTHAYVLLEQWLSAKPDDSIVDAWKDYVSALKEVMESDSFADLKKHVIESTRSVADAAGGLLGIGAISKKETETITELEDAFS